MDRSELDAMRLKFSEIWGFANESTKGISTNLSSHSWLNAIAFNQKASAIHDLQIKAAAIGVTTEEWRLHQSIVHKMAVSSLAFANSAVMLAGAELIYQLACSGKGIIPKYKDDAIIWGKDLWDLTSGDSQLRSFSAYALNNPEMFSGWLNTAISLWDEDCNRI